MTTETSYKCQRLNNSRQCTQTPTREALNVQRNIEARLFNHCCSGKAMRITRPVCVCSLRYPACNVQAPYYQLWSASLYNIFPHYLINDTIFGKKVIEHKIVFRISL